MAYKRKRTSSVRRSKRTSKGISKRRKTTRKGVKRTTSKIARYVNKNKRSTAKGGNYMDIDGHGAYKVSRGSKGPMVYSTRARVRKSSKGRTINYRKSNAITRGRKAFSYMNPVRPSYRPKVSKPISSNVEEIEYEKDLEDMKASHPERGSFMKPNNAYTYHDADGDSGRVPEGYFHTLEADTGMEPWWSLTGRDVNPYLNRAVRTAGRLVGNVVYPGFGGEIGDYSADYLHRGIKSIFGVGDYTVKSNTIMSDPVPQFGNNGRSTRIRHREYITDILTGPMPTGATGTSFTVQQFVVNPGVEATFPWLSRIAQSYEEYKIKGMVFEFKSTSGDSLTSTNTSLGTVIQASQYNVLSPVFQNKQAMENYEFGTSCKPSLSQMHIIECEPHETPQPELFVRNLNTYNGDNRLYDHCNYSIATVGMQAAGINIGELWVSYDIEFLKPKVGEGGEGTETVLMDHYITANAAASAPIIAAGLPVRTDSNLGTSCTTQVVGTSNNSTITIPGSFAGTLFVSLSAQSVAPGIGVASNGKGNCTAQNNLLNNMVSTLNQTNSTGQMNQLMTYQCTGGSQSFVLSLPTAWTGANTVDLFIFGITNVYGPI